MENAFIIFGATGDLTARKLLPAIYNLAYEKKLSDEFFCVCIGRRDKTTDSFRKEIRESIEKFSRNGLNEEIFKKLEQKFFYFKMSFDQEDKYKELDNFIKEKEIIFNTKSNRIYYLAVSPDYFEIIVNFLHKNNMEKAQNAWRRVMIEKPFGNDLKSAKKLNKTITKVFTEENTYRIDHYLGKEMLQNIMVVRFANEILEYLWNNKYIDHIQIISAEKMGIQNRGGYYEKSGAFKDMLQNHLMQILSVIAMEAPINLDTESIRDEKVKVLRSIRKIDDDYIKENIVKAQYSQSLDGEIKAYREEDRVDPSSNVETLVAAKFMIDNFRWSGVPFYILTAKRMPITTTKVVIHFKKTRNLLYDTQNSDNNKLTIKIQPEEGVDFNFNVKKIGSNNELRQVKMDYCQNCDIAYNSPEAYEILIKSAIDGEKAIFTRWDEVEYSWEIIDNITKVLNEQEKEIFKYPANTISQNAIDLIEKDGKRWDF